MMKELVELLRELPGNREGMGKKKKVPGTGPEGSRADSGEKKEKGPPSAG